MLSVSPMSSSWETNGVGAEESATWMQPVHVSSAPDVRLDRISSSVGFAADEDRAIAPSCVDRLHPCGIGRQESQTGSFRSCVGNVLKENSEELTAAALKGKIDEAKKLLTKGRKSFLSRTGKPVNPDSRDSEGFTALFLAVQEGHLPLITALIDAGADPCLAGSAHGVTPTCLAAGQGDVKALMLLLEKGGCLNTPSQEGVTPLLIAAQNGHFAAVQYLIAQQADVEACTEDGDSALVCAARNGHVEVAQLLVQKGADKHRRGQGGRTALQWAHIKVKEAEKRRALAELLQA